MKRALATAVLALALGSVAAPSWAATITPEGPTVDPVKCDDGDGYAAMIVIPEQDGVAYSRETEMVGPGEYTITAAPLGDNTFDADATTEWTLVVEPVAECAEPAEAPAPQPPPAAVVDPPARELPDTGAPWRLAIIGAAALAAGGASMALRRHTRGGTHGRAR